MQKTLPRPSSEVEAELKKAKRSLTNARTELERVETQCKSLEAEIKLLTGGLWYPNGGQINDLKHELKQSLQYESDLTKPKVVWLVPKYNADDRDYRVSRVTPKRIYIRELGCNHETYYDRQGVPSYGTERIDVEATLGKGEAK